MKILAFYILGMIVETIWLYGFRDHRESMIKSFKEIEEKRSGTFNEKELKSMFVLSMIVNAIFWPVNMILFTIRIFSKVKD